VETAGDCYIAAGGLTIIDEDGFISIDPEPKPDQSAQRVLAFAKVRMPATCVHLGVHARGRARPSLPAELAAPLLLTIAVIIPALTHTHAHTHNHTLTPHTQAILQCAKSVPMPHNGEPTQIRVGMHTGPAVTGLIGTKLPKYSVFGDTMWVGAVAARRWWWGGWKCMGWGV